jgi:RNA-binding protein
MLQKMNLTGKQKRYLRGMGHGIKPIVTVGKHGITEDLVKELDGCLAVHELVKVKVLESCPVSRKDAGVQLSEATASGLAQTLGRTVLLYRPHAEDPRIVLPE